MKNRLLIIALLPLLFFGCDSLFDEGDVEKTYDGPTLVAFFPTQQEISLADGSASVEVQLIGEQRSSDLAVSFSVSGESTAQAGVHFNILTPSPVTLPANSSTVDIQIETIPGSLAEGEATLILNLEGGDGVAASVNQATHTAFVSP